MPSSATVPTLNIAHLVLTLAALSRANIAFLAFPCRLSFAQRIEFRWIVSHRLPLALPSAPATFTRFLHFTPSRVLAPTSFGAVDL